MMFWTDWDIVFKSKNVAGCTCTNMICFQKYFAPASITEVWRNKNTVWTHISVVYERPFLALVETNRFFITIITFLTTVTSKDVFSVFCNGVYMCVLDVVLFALYLFFPPRLKIWIKSNQRRSIGDACGDDWRRWICGGAFFLLVAQTCLRVDFGWVSELRTSLCS